MLVAWKHFAPPDIKTNLIYEVAGYAYTYLRMKEARQIKDVDILFLGSSHTYRGFDPRIFKEYGYKTFNMGSSNQTPLQTKVLLDRYLNTLNPKLIVYEVTPINFEYDGVESSLDILANDKLDLESLKMAFTINHIKTYNTLLYSCYLSLLNRKEIFEQDTVSGSDTYISGGYVQSKILHNREGFDNYEKSNWVPVSHQLKAFESILHTINKKRIRFILVQAPVSRHEYENCYNDNDHIDAYFLSKTPYYYNFNNILKVNDSLDFFDAHHLTQSAVRVFNEELISRIIKNIHLSQNATEAGN